MPWQACRWQQAPTAACRGSGMPGRGIQPARAVGWSRGGVGRAASFSRVPAPPPLGKMCLLEPQSQFCCFFSLTPASCPWKAELKTLGVGVGVKHTELPPGEGQTLHTPPHSPPEAVDILTL